MLRNLCTGHGLPALSSIATAAQGQASMLQSLCNFCQVCPVFVQPMRQRGSVLFIYYISFSIYDFGSFLHPLCFESSGRSLFLEFVYGTFFGGLPFGANLLMGFTMEKYAHKYVHMDHIGKYCARVDSVG